MKNVEISPGQTGPSLTAGGSATQRTIQPCNAILDKPDLHSRMNDSIARGRDKKGSRTGSVNLPHDSLERARPIALPKTKLIKARGINRKKGPFGQTVDYPGTT